MCSLLADEAVTKLASTDVSRGQQAEVGAESQPSDTTIGHNILVLNDLWRYVPAYFHALDADQPRSEAGRRLLERRRRQRERQQQQQQHQSETDASSECQRGTLPVDELLAYITNSAINNHATTSTPGSIASRRGRRKNKQSTPPSSQAVVMNGCSSSEPVLDAASEGRAGENVLRESGKKQKQPSNVPASDVTDADASGFVVVRRGGKHRSEKPAHLQTTEVLLGRRNHQKTTFYDSLDEFSLHGCRVEVNPRAEQVPVSAVASERSALISTSTQSLQAPPHSTDTPNLQTADLRHSTTAGERLRPTSLRYNDVIKLNTPSWPKESVVASSTKRLMNCQQTDSCSRHACSINHVQTTNTPTGGNGGSFQDLGVLSTSVELVDVQTTSLDREASPGDTTLGHVISHVVEKVDSSTQTSSVGVPPYTATSSNNYTSVDEVGHEPCRPNPVVFLDSNGLKSDVSEDRQRQLALEELSFGSFDDVTKPRDDDEAVRQTGSVVRECSDAATSPVQFSPSTSSTPTPMTVASHSRRITPLSRATGSSSSVLGAPVGIVPPILHVVTASGDMRVFADDHTLRKDVSRCPSSC